jgi:hypothetical protein
VTACYRLLLVLLMLAACLAGAAVGLPRGLDQLGLDWLAGDQANAQATTLMDYRTEVARRRIEEKHAVIGRLVAGQLSLVQAAALFRQLDATPEDCPGPDRSAWSGRSEEEKLCRQVIHWARNEARHTSAEPDALVARLGAELAEALARDGSVHLPD